VLAVVECTLGIGSLAAIMKSWLAGRAIETADDRAGAPVF
jgi:hypothetical protein